MSRFVVSCFDGGGAVPPTLSVARALVERGHDVRVLTEAVLAPDVAATGAEHVPFRHAPSRAVRSRDTEPVPDWLAETPQQAIDWVVERLVCGEAAAYARDLLDTLEDRPADVVTADLLIPGVLIGAEAAGVPRALMSTSPFAAPGWGLPPFGPGFPPAENDEDRMRDEAVWAGTAELFDRHLPALNAARAQVGLEPVDSVLGQMTSADRLLMLTSRAMEHPTFCGPPHVVHAGARLDDPHWCEPWTPPEGDGPLVLVALSTTYQGQQDVLRRCAEAVSSLGLRGIVTTGLLVGPDEVPAPPGVTVVRGVPHSQVLPHASCVVTHAGHGTAAKALAAGVPLVCLPMGRDQAEVAQRAVGRGAAVRLEPTAPVGDIAAAVRQVLEDPSFAEAARRVAAGMAEERREDRAVAELEALATMAAVR